MQVKIKVTGLEETKRHLESIKIKVPEEVRESINTWGGQLKDKYRLYLQGRQDTGKGQMSVKWIPLTKSFSRGYVSMREEAYFLSANQGMYPQKIGGMFNRGSRIRRWMSRQGMGAPIYSRKKWLGPGKPYFNYIGRIYGQHVNRISPYLRHAVARGMQRT